MSSWTYIDGYVHVEPVGCSGQRALDFVLGSVVDHLPPVTGSEGDMDVEILRDPGTNSSCNHDEFGQTSNLGRSPLGGKGDWFDVQTGYKLVLTGWLRDRKFDETLREFCKWMTRLSKRVRVDDMLVRLSGGGRSKLFNGAGGWEGNVDDWSWIPENWHLRNWRHRPEQLPLHYERRWADLRYGIMPHIDGNWVENLVNVVPSGARVVREVDYIAGNLEPYEYDGVWEYERDAAILAERMMRTRDGLAAWESMADESEGTGASDED